jgi:hypothetical protein
MKSLQVLHFNPSKLANPPDFTTFLLTICRVMAHPRVLAWHGGFDMKSTADEDEMDNEEAIASFYNGHNSSWSY